MFKKFNDKENISGTTQVKSSVVRSIREKLLNKYPEIKDYLDQILPKKEPIKLIKWRCCVIESLPMAPHTNLDSCSLYTWGNFHHTHDRIEILAVGGEPVFFKQRDDFMPTLKLLHKYPFLLPQQQVDRGAIQFVLSGANIMCPGLTSPGANLVQADKETVVAVMAEGKQHALAIGVMKMSTEDIKSVNKGIGVENVHYLLDGLWHMKAIKK